MRVLHLVKTGYGAPWALMQMRELVEMGVEVHVALPPNSIRENQYAQAGVSVHTLQTDFPVKRPWRFPALRSAFRDLVGTLNPDLIHSHFVGTTLTMRLALGRNHPIPRVFQVPGPLHLEHPFFRHAEFSTAGEKDYWFAACMWTRACYAGMLKNDADRVDLIYYGKKLTEFDLPSQPTTGLRESLSIAESTKVVGMVAYMYPPKKFLGQRRGLKGHEDLIDALRICRDRGLDVVGVFVGGSSIPGHSYERQVQVYGQEVLGKHALFLGTRSDIQELYTAFDVAVHPSHSENLGGAAESLMLEVPTIATNVGGFPDIVMHGVTGLLTPPRDPEKLASAIANMLEDPKRAKEMAVEGRKLSRQLLDIEANSKEVYRAYRRILDHDQYQG